MSFLQKISVDDASNDDQYDPLADKTVNVTIVDNDSPGITSNPNSLSISEPNGTGRFTIKLNTQPTANVTINSISASNGECSVSPTSTIIANILKNGKEIVLTRIETLRDRVSTNRAFTSRDANRDTNRDASRSRLYGLSSDF